MATEPLKEAFAALAAGNMPEAVRRFEDALKAEPDDADALLGLARTHLARRSLDEARSPLQRLVTIEPKHHEAQSHLAMIDALAGDELSLQKLRNLSARAGAGFYEHFNLGIVLASQDELDDAELALEKAIQAEPASFHALIESGNLAMRRKDHARAIQRFQAATVVGGPRSLPFALLARAHQAKGERGKAIAALAEAIRRAPSERPLFEELYRLCMDAGAPKQAAGAASELLRLDPKSGGYLVLQGDALLASGRIDEARKSFLSAHESDPDAFAPTLGLGRVARAAKDSEQAKVWLERSVATGTPDLRPSLELAEVLLDLGREDHAERVLTKPYANHPEDARVNLLLARALRTRDRSRAIAHARKAANAKAVDLKDQAEKLLREL